MIEFNSVKPIKDNAIKCDLSFILLPNRINIINDKMGKNKKEDNLMSMKVIILLTL